MSVFLTAWLAVCLIVSLSVIPSDRETEDRKAETERHRCRATERQNNARTDADIDHKVILTFHYYKRIGRLGMLGRLGQFWPKMFDGLSFTRYDLVK